MAAKKLCPRTLRWVAASLARGARTWTAIAERSAGNAELYARRRSIANILREEATDLRQRAKRLGRLPSD